MSQEHSAAELLRVALVAAGLGVMRTQQADSAAWPIYIGHLPDKPDNCICIYDTPGTTDGRLMRTGQTIRHPGWQVRVRATNHRQTWLKIMAIADHFDKIIQKYISLDGFSYLLKAITQTTGALPLGQENDGKRRDSLTLNGILTMSHDASGSTIFDRIISGESVCCDQVLIEDDAYADNTTRYYRLGSDTTDGFFIEYLIEGNGNDERGTIRLSYTAPVVNIDWHEYQVLTGSEQEQIVLSADVHNGSIRLVLTGSGAGSIYRLRALAKPL